MTSYITTTNIITNIHLRAAAGKLVPAGVNLIYFSVKLFHVTDFFLHLLEIQEINFCRKIFLFLFYFYFFGKFIFFKPSFSLCLIFSHLKFIFLENIFLENYFLELFFGKLFFIFLKINGQKNFVKIYRRIFFKFITLFVRRCF